MLLVTVDEVPAATAVGLERLGASGVVVLGGDAAVGAGVAEVLEGATAD